MDNFLNYLTKHLDPEQVDIWFRVNNIIPEKMELYYELSYSLYLLISITYMGNYDVGSETNVKMEPSDNQKHFDWCWDKNLKNFGKENILFEERGEHYDYFQTFFNEIFYNQDKLTIKNSIDLFFDDLFNRDKPFTQVDLDLIFNIYKTLDKNLTI